MKINTISAMGFSYAFDFEDPNHIYAQEPVNTFCGFPCKQVAFRKINNRIYAKLEIDWSKVPNNCEYISGTKLIKRGFVSSNSLSDATIYKLAILPNKGIVSLLRTTYWASDKGDVPAWEFNLRSKEEYLDTSKFPLEV